MNHIIIRHLISFVLILHCGCVAYYPQMVDIPLIEEKEDFRMDYGMSLMSIHGTVSYGLTDMIAVQVYGNTNLLTRYDLQGAIGYYKWFEESLTEMELYCGYGYGHYRHVGFNSVAEPGDYHSAFTQFNIGKVESGSFDVDFGMGLKSGYMFSNFVDTDLIANPKKNGLFFEPTVFFRFWVGNKKSSIKASYFFPVTIDKRYSKFIPFNIGITRQF